MCKLCSTSKLTTLFLSSKGLHLSIFTDDHRVNLR